MEFTQAQIKDFAQTDENYQRAATLVNEKRIGSLEIDDYSMQELILIYAVVQDGKLYHEVNMSVDKEDYLVKAHMCNCNKHENAQICEHCTAVLLKLFEEQEHRIVKDSLDQNTLKDAWALQVMNKYEDSIVYSTLALNLKQSIRIEPVLEIRNRDVLAVTLKVGETKRYVVKDLEGFLHDIDTNARKRYGNELELLHHRNSFDDASQVLLDFLYAHRGDTLFFLNTYHYRNAPQSKNLCLTPHALDEFYHMYEGQDVYYRVKANTLTNMKFVSANPPLHLIVSKDKDGYHITLNDMNFLIFPGMETIYILHKHSLYRCTSSYAKNCRELLMTFYKKRDALHLSEEFMPNFYHNVILSVKNDMPMEGDDLSKFAPLPLITRLYLDLPQYDVLSVKLVYCYGDMRYNAFSTDAISAARNFNDEIAIRLILTRYMTRIDAGDGFAYIEHSQDAMYDFLSRGIAELSDNCEIYTSENMRHLKIKDRFSISMGVRIDTDLLEISFDAYDFPIDELADVLKAYRLNKKYYRMKDGSFVNIEDSAMSELSYILDGLQVKESEIEQGIIKTEKFRALYLDNVVKNTEMIQVDRASTFKEIVRNIRNFEDSDFNVPESMRAILRNYQKSGFRWLKTMASYGFGGILADDMGIGKTIQVIALLQDEKNHNKDAITLVVCPSSLLLNWQNEIDKFSDNLSSIIISGNGDERKALLHSHKHYDVMITSYDYLKRDIDWYETMTFTYQILDEAQYIKNHTTKNAQCVKKIHAIHKFALTGTPIENSLAELWSIFDFLMPGYLYNYAYFKGVFEIAIVKENDRSVLEKLRRMVEPFILRRVKKDVLKELPEKVEKTLLIDLDETARKAYMANVALIRDDLTTAFATKGISKSRIMILSMLTRLRQFCCDPRLIYENYDGASAKLDACMELIENCISSGKKVLLFSQFTSLLSLLEDALSDQGIPYYLLKGSTPKAQRQHLVNAFNTNDIPVFLISLKAGGTGLNLTSAEVVIHFDPWWNVSAQNQATDRAYRIGQHNNVQVFKLIARDTIEEKIMLLQEKKKDLHDSIITQSDGIITNMTQEEILDLF